MQHTYDFSEGGRDSELAIVDTFTKLIFGEVSALNSGELLVIQALRTVDNNVALDTHQQMGEYLRALGVREMIELVSRVRVQLGSDAAMIPAGSVDPETDQRAH